VTGDLRDRIARTLHDHEMRGIPRKPGDVDWISMHETYLARADALLPLFAEVKATARAEVQERVGAALIASEGDSKFVVIGMVRAALGGTTPERHVWFYGDELAAKYVAQAAWPWERTENREGWAPKMLTDRAIAVPTIAKAQQTLASAVAHVRAALGGTEVPGDGD
jgi:hypothetical protein